MAWEWRQQDQDRSQNIHQVKPGVLKPTFPVKQPGFPMASNYAVSPGSTSPELGGFRDVEMLEGPSLGIEI